MFSEGNDILKDPIKNEKELNNEKVNIELQIIDISKNIIQKIV